MATQAKRGGMLDGAHKAEPAAPGKASPAPKAKPKGRYRIDGVVYDLDAATVLGERTDGDDTSTLYCAHAGGCFLFHERRKPLAKGEVRITVDAQAVTDAQADEWMRGGQALAAARPTRRGKTEPAAPAAGNARAAARPARRRKAEPTTAIWRFPSSSAATSGTATR